MDGEEDLEKGEPKPKKVKAGRSTMYSFVRFYNRTARFVDVVWLNYEGIGVKYVTLKPRQFVDINTFVGHPWIFRDNHTGEKMVVQRKDVYEPEEIEWQGDPHNSRPQRKLVFITIPVYSLKDRCLREVRKLVPWSDLNKLEIPATLIKRLHEMDNTSAHDRQNSNGIPSTSGNNG